MNECACGCGTAIPAMSKLRRPQQFVWGHNAKLQTKSPCRVVTCRIMAHSKGYCGAHLMRLKKYGTIHPVTARLDSRRYFWSLVLVPAADGDCWIWTGPKTRYGYGRAGFCEHLSPSRTRMAHRVTYEWYHGAVPDPELHMYIRPSDGSRLCRDCRYAQHVARRKAGLVTAAEAMRTHCFQGHELTPENSKYDGPRRQCRECARRSARDYARRQRALKAEILLGVD